MKPVFFFIALAGTRCAVPFTELTCVVPVCYAGLASYQLLRSFWLYNFGKDAVFQAHRCVRRPVGHIAASAEERMHKCLAGVMQCSIIMQACVDQQKKLLSAECQQLPRAALMPEFAVVTCSRG